jgi:DNA invertase Pin-like site-specific DNA recombinase
MLSSVQEILMITIIYTRFSSDMQRQDSCLDQERKVREYLHRNGIPLGEIAVLKDEAVSGTKEAHKAFDQIKARIDRREPFLLAVDDQSRLSRGDNVKGLIRDLVFAGGRFISAGENVDTDQPGWEMKVGIMEIHNSLTISELSRRVRRGQEGRVLDVGVCSVRNGEAGRCAQRCPLQERALALALLRAECSNGLARRNGALVENERKMS